MHRVKENTMLPRSIPPLNKEQWEQFQKELQEKPSKKLAETLKRAKAVYDSNPL